MRRVPTLKAAAPLLLACALLSPTAPARPQSGQSDVVVDRLPGDTRLEMVVIPAGTFTMGSSSGDRNESPAHRVTITRPFAIGMYEVTQAQWRAVMDTSPSYFKGEYLPVESVSWDDAEAFVARLNAIDNGHRYRLPTEAEWEYACRAGTSGDFAGQLDAMGWYARNSGMRRLGDADLVRVNMNVYGRRLRDNGCRSHEVGEKRPNAWGIFDMHGNVWEWCADLYGAYAAEAAADPSGPRAGSDRVVRGGSWSDAPDLCRSADRVAAPPGYRDGVLGFRLARSLDPSDDIALGRAEHSPAAGAPRQ